MPKALAGNRMSKLEKGGLYLIDDSFRERCKATAMATLAMATSGTATATGTKYLSNWKPYENGIVILASIENHNSGDKAFDICKVMFNNKSGMRFLYREALELAERVDNV